MGGADTLATWVASSLLLSLRVSPVLVFAPPFSLVRVPRLIAWLLGLGIAITLVAANPATALVSRIDSGTLLVGAAREVSLGLVPVLALHMLFGALYLAGRTIDIQSGFGLALLIDPATRGQTALVGTIFAYLAGATFFALDGHHDVLRFLSLSLDLVPLGGARGAASLDALTGYVFAVFLTAFGVAALTVLALFLADLSIAMLSRTVPQMNALLIGIQVKALLVIITLPIAIGVSGAVFARLIGDALRAMARLV